MTFAEAWQGLQVALRLLPLILQIIGIVRRLNLTIEGQKELTAMMVASADDFVAKAKQAMDSVSDNPDDVTNDPANRDN